MLNQRLPVPVDVADSAADSEAELLRVQVLPVQVRLVLRALPEPVLPRVLPRVDSVDSAAVLLRVPVPPVQDRLVPRALLRVPPRAVSVDSAVV